MFLDCWPPNYWGGYTNINSDTGASESVDQGMNKYVCIECKREIHIHKVYARENDTTTEAKRIVYDEPLVARADCLLTKHDVWREDYREAHGIYPREAYG